MKRGKSSTEGEASFKPCCSSDETFNQFPSSLRSRQGWAHYLELKRTPEPHLHQIEPTNHCVYSCIMCPRPKKMKREVGFMKFDLFTKIIDEVSSYSEPIRSREIELFHFGESLLHPEIDRMAGYASLKGLRITMSVNGPQLQMHDQIILVHAFSKKSQQLRMRDIELAEKRMQDWIYRHSVGGKV